MDYYDGWPNRHKEEILFEEPLVMTEYQRRSAINDKAIFLAFIHPVKFVKATINHHQEIDRICKEAEHLSFYNGLHRQGKIQYPFIKYDPETLKIIGHEGRHRMFGVFTDYDGQQKVPVFFKSYWRLDEVNELKFPMKLEYEFHDNAHLTINKSDIIEFYPKETWFGY